MGRNRCCQLRRLITLSQNPVKTGKLLKQELVCVQMSQHKETMLLGILSIVWVSPGNKKTKTKEIGLAFPSSLLWCFRRKQPKVVLEKPGAWLAAWAWLQRTVSNVFRINTPCSSNLDEGPWRKQSGMSRTKPRRDVSWRGNKLRHRKLLCKQGWKVPGSKLNMSQWYRIGFHIEKLADFWSGRKRKKNRVYRKGLKAILWLFSAQPNALPGVLSLVPNARTFQKSYKRLKLWKRDPTIQDKGTGSLILKKSRQYRRM